MSIKVKDLRLEDEVYLTTEVSSSHDLSAALSEKTAVNLNSKFISEIDVKVVGSTEFNVMKDEDIDDKTLYVLSDDFIDMNYNEIKHLKPAVNGDEAVNLHQLSTNYIAKAKLWEAISSSTNFDELMTNLRVVLA